MSRYYRSDKKGVTAVMIVLTIVMAVVIFFAIATKGFTVSDPTQWFGGEAEQEEELTLDTKQLVFSKASTTAPEVKIINATLTSDDVSLSDSDTTIEWSLSYVGDATAVSGVTVTPSDDGSTASIVCSAPFSKSIQAKAYVPGTDYVAVCTLEYATTLKEVCFSDGSESVITWYVNAAEDQIINVSLNNVSTLDFTGTVTVYFAPTEIYSGQMYFSGSPFIKSNFEKIEIGSYEISSDLTQVTQSMLFSEVFEPHARKLLASELEGETPLQTALNNYSYDFQAGDDMTCVFCLIVEAEGTSGGVASSASCVLELYVNNT